MRTSKQVEERTKGKERKDRVREAGKEKKREEVRLSVVLEKEDMEKELVQQMTISH